MPSPAIISPDSNSCATCLICTTSTNGTLLTKDIIRFIGNHKNKIVVQIDLHGSNPKYVEWFTNSSVAYQKEIDTISDLTSEGVMVRVVSSVTPLNIDQMENVAKIAKERGALAVMFSPVVAMGRAQDWNNEIIFSGKEEKLKFINNMDKLMKTYGAKFVSLLDERKKSLINCGAGTQSITVSPSGFIKLCQMGKELLGLGNLFETHIQYILKKNKDFFLMLENLPAPSPKICSDCSDIQFCSRCLARGIIKAKKKGDNCIWAKKYILGTPLEKILLY